LVCSSSDQSYDGEFDSDAELWESNVIQPVKPVNSSKFREDAAVSDSSSPKPTSSSDPTKLEARTNRLSVPLIITKQNIDNNFWALTETQVLGLKDCGIPQSSFEEFLASLSICMKVCRFKY
jgi:hypothetical protein